MDSERRIPICAGFYIKFSKDGHAIHGGRDESVALQTVESWLQRNKDHKDLPVVEQWVRQKKKQMQEDLLEQCTRARREAINEMVDKNARESSLRDKELVELVREHAFKVRGISPKEDSAER